MLPGVPVFFFASGFLISGSFERNRNIRAYARNRFLRIFPPMWASTLLSALLILILYPVPVLSLAGSAIAQGTILQDWNPGFLRGYGVGVANGAIWTIPVELSFYVSTPILYWLGRKHVDWLLAVTAIVSFAILAFMMTLPDGSFVEKLIGVSPLPWIGMFACGALAQRHFETIRPYIAGKFLIWLALTGLFIMAAMWLDAPPLLFSYGQNAPAPIAFLLLAGLTLSAAYTVPTLAETLLRRQDISYGVYIYHMPVINALLEASIGNAAWAIALTLLVAIASWRFIEQPALRMKLRPAREV